MRCREDQYDWVRSNISAEFSVYIGVARGPVERSMKSVTLRAKKIDIHFNELCMNVKS